MRLSCNPINFFQRNLIDLVVNVKARQIDPVIRYDINQIVGRAVFAEQNLRKDKHVTTSGFPIGKCELVPQHWKFCIHEELAEPVSHPLWLMDKQHWRQYHHLFCAVNVRYFSVKKKSFALCFCQVYLEVNVWFFGVQPDSYALQLFLQQGFLYISLGSIKHHQNQVSCPCNSNNLNHNKEKSFKDYNFAFQKLMTCLFSSAFSLRSPFNDSREIQ